MGMFSGLFGALGNGYVTTPALYNHDAERQARLEAYRKAWEAYQADLPDPVVIDGPSNDNVKTNPARAIINTGVFFLFGNELKFQVSPDVAERSGSAPVLTAASNPDPLPVTPDWLQDLNKAWKANRKKSLLFNLGLSGSVTGTPFIKIVPNAAGLSNEFPRLVLLDPANIDVMWDPNDCTRVMKYCIEYLTENDQGEPVLQIQEIEANQDAFGTTQSWTMQDYTQPMGFVTGVGYVPAEGERLPVGPPIEWPYAWAPIESCQNVELPHEFWGLPDLDSSCIEVIESYQRAMSSLNKIVRIHASPRMYAKNVMPDQMDEIDVSADNIITLPNMDADLSVLQTLSNLSPSIDFTDKMLADLLRMVQVPAIALGDFSSASTSISGVTLSILYAPLLQKTELKRISYGDMIERLNAKMLILMGYSPDEFESLVLVWPESMPGSSYLERQTLQQDQLMGASQYTIMSRLGYDPVEEETRRIEERVHEVTAISEVEAQFGVQAQTSFNVGGTPQTGGAKVGLSSGSPAPSGQSETPSKNNNPAGKGGSGSMGATGNTTPKKK